MLLNVGKIICTVKRGTNNRGVTEYDPRGLILDLKLGKKILKKSYNKIKLIDIIM